MCQKLFESVQRRLLLTYVKYKLSGLLYTYLTLPFLMRTATDLTGQPIFTPNGSKDAVWRKEVPFGGLIDDQNFMRDSTQENPSRADREMDFPL